MVKLPIAKVAEKIRCGRRRKSLDRLKPSHWPSFPQAGMGRPTLTEKIHSYRIAAMCDYLGSKDKAMTSNSDNSNADRDFSEFRRKVRAAEVLSASMERLLLSLRFTGRVSVVMQNGRVLKAGYEESYFCQRADRADADDEITQKTVEVKGAQGRMQAAT
jgi:hypothetical protein